MKKLTAGFCAIAYTTQAQIDALEEETARQWQYHRQ